MTQAELSYMLADLSGVSASAINPFTDLNVLNVTSEDIANELNGSMWTEPDVEYISALGTVDELLDYINGG